MWIPNHTADSQIETAKNDIFPVVLDECYDLSTRFTLNNILDVIVDRGVLMTFHRIRENFSLDIGVFKSHLTPCIAVTFDPRHKEIGLHLLIYVR